MQVKQLKPTNLTEAENKAEALQSKHGLRKVIHLR